MNRKLPTIKQIIQQADLIGETPMTDAESRAWFERTCKENENADDETYYDNFEDGRGF
jgi:hypothetical protein